jgi:Flp pilus assembly protein TadD
MPSAPDSAEAERLIQAALGSRRAGDTQGETSLLQQVVRLDPRHQMALTRLGTLAIERQDHAAATTHAQRVLADEPNCAPALATLAQACWLAGKPAEGLPMARRAMEIQPRHAEFRLIYAHLCIWLGRYAEAEALLDALLAEDWLQRPSRVRALHRRGELDIARGRFRDAVAWTRASLALEPHDPTTHMIHGTNLLRLGQFEEGWRSYAIRDQIPFFYPAGIPSPPGEKWTGQDPRGKTILLRDDQGYGDAIQFFRYLPLVRRLGPTRIVLQTFPLLQDMMAASTQVAEVVTDMPPDLQPDLHCLTANLPGLFSSNEGTIPVSVPYVRPPNREPRDGLRLPTGQGRHARGGERLNVGLVWSGDPRHLSDHLRSIPASRFLRISGVRGVRFYCLQPLIRAGDIPAVEAHPAVDRIGERFADFGDTASVVSQLDLVITVDTSVAHLAGALGKPVWILLPLAPDWRWLTDRDDSPWYPTARLFRCGLDGWDPVLARVETALRAMVRP